MSLLDSVTQDKSAFPVTDTVREEFTRLAEVFAYRQLNTLASTTIATTPAVARGTTATKAKTTNATVVRSAGALVALGASDDYWTFAGGVLAVSSFRRYLLCTNAAGTASAIASDDSLVSAAACRFSGLPADGVAIVGVVSIATDSTHAWTAGTTNLNATGITATFIDNVDADVLKSFARRVNP